MAAPAAVRSAGRELVDAFSRLLAHAAHDLNNQLATILGKAEIGLMVEDPARWRRGLEETFAAGQQARVIVSDLQQVARWHDAEADPITVADALGIAARLAARAVERCGATLRVEASVPGRVLAEPAAITVGTSLLVRAAAEGRAVAARTWTLAARREVDGWSMTLDLGHDPVDPARVAQVGARTLAELGAEIACEPHAVRVRFRD